MFDEIRIKKKHDHHNNALGATYSNSISPSCRITYDIKDLSV